jgi:hypothetical protein
MRGLRRTCSLVALAAFASAAQAQLSLSSNWGPTPPCIDGPKTSEELAEVQQGRRSPGVCPLSESQKVRAAAMQKAYSLSPIPPKDEVAEPAVDHGFKMKLGQAQYYVLGSRFMAKSFEGEVCTPTRGATKIPYTCVEGQRRTETCHLLFLTKDFEPAGHLPLKVNRPYQTFCNATIAMGVADKSRNELLVTIQYFPIDRKLASKINEVGSGWERMTVLVRLKEDDGRIVAEQDDRCLKNPNRIETISDARRALRRCTPVAKS